MFSVLALTALSKPSLGGRWQPEGLTDEGKTAEKTS